MHETDNILMLLIVLLDNKGTFIFNLVLAMMKYGLKYNADFEDYNQELVQYIVQSLIT